MKKTIIFGSIICVIVWVVSLILPASIPTTLYQTDFARVEKEIIDREYTFKKREEIIHLIEKHKDGIQKISIAGKRYSGGGHTFSSGGLVIDMSQFNNILEYDSKSKIITVESGITWGEIQAFIHNDGLSIQVMQSSNIFSVGGSLSSNIHGRDPRIGTIVDSVQSFRLITADGVLRNVSRYENPELFSTVIGGFGLLGVITDVTLYLRDNETYNRTVHKIDYDNYASYLEDSIIGKEDIGLHYGRLSIVPGINFLKDFHITNYALSSEIIESQLTEEKWVLRNRFFFNLSRKYDWAKSLRWYMQKTFTDNINSTTLIDRNNAMRPPIKFISYYSDTDTDILHEYFVPLKNYHKFIDELRDVLQENKVNLLSVTTRYVPKGGDILVNYNTDDMISIVLYMNVGLSQPEQEKIRGYTSDLIDFAGDLGGAYYLVYQNYASPNQIRNIYPNFNNFIKIKGEYDPNGLFSNKFYEIYK